MLRNYLVIAYRNLLRHKAFSLINILGLAETHMHETASYDLHQFGYKFYGKGRSVGCKKGGGLGLLVKDNLGLEVSFAQDLEDIFTHNVQAQSEVMNIEIKCKRDSFFMTLVYMGVNSADNWEKNKLLYELLTKVREKIGDAKWILMGDFNGHIGLLGEDSNMGIMLV